MIITNDFRKELKNIGITLEVSDNTESIKFIKNDKTIDIKIDTIRRIFLNSIVSHIDNSLN